MADTFDDDDIHKAHDGIVKRSFEIIENAVGELQAVLPKALVDAIDWASLALVTQASVSGKLRFREIDLLYRVEIRGHPAFLYTVFEAQRSIDKTMPLRMFIYMARIWDDWLRQRNGEWPPPPIVPIVLHHGDGKWHRSTQFADILELDEQTKRAIAPFTPHFEFVLDDLAAVPDQVLLERTLSLVAKLVLGALKHGSQPGLAQSFFTTWQQPLRELLAQTEGTDELETILWYFLQVNPTIDRRELGALMQEEFGPKAEKALMTAGQRMMQEARQQGLRQGLEQGQTEILLELLSHRFGQLPPETRRRVQAANVELIARWAKRLLDVETLEQVFAD